MTMEQRPEHVSSSSEASASPQGASRLDALIGETLRERADGVAPAPDALAQLNARLDAAAPAPKWWALRPRLVGAGAAALILLVIFTPVGRLAAAGVQNATQTIITTVKEIATGGGDDSPKTQPGTPIVPGRANSSSTTLMPTNGVGSPGSTGTVGGIGTTGTATQTPTSATSAAPTTNVAPIAGTATIAQRPTDTTGGTTPTTATEPASQVSTQTSSPTSAASTPTTATIPPASTLATATRIGTTTGTTTGSAPVATPPSRSGTIAPPTPTATISP